MDKKADFFDLPRYNVRESPKSPSAKKSIIFYSDITKNIALYLLCIFTWKLAGKVHINNQIIKKFFGRPF